MNIIQSPRAAQAFYFWNSCRLALSGDPAESFRGLARISAIRTAATSPVLRDVAASWIGTYIGGGYAVLPVQEASHGR